MLQKELQQALLLPNGLQGQFFVFEFCVYSMCILFYCIITSKLFKLQARLCGHGGHTGNVHLNLRGS